MQTLLSDLERIEKFCVVIYRGLTDSMALPTHCHGPSISSYGVCRILMARLKEPKGPRHIRVKVLRSDENSL